MLRLLLAYETFIDLLLWPAGQFLPERAAYPTLAPSSHLLAATTLLVKLGSFPAL